jgi:hypothetical protein
MKAELLETRENGYLDESYFKDFQWVELNRILDDTDNFFKETCQAELKGASTVQDYVENAEKLKKV